MPLHACKKPLPEHNQSYSQPAACTSSCSTWEDRLLSIFSLHGSCLQLLHAITLRFLFKLLNQLQLISSSNLQHQTQGLADLFSLLGLMERRFINHHQGPTQLGITAHRPGIEPMDAVVRQNA